MAEAGLEVVGRWVFFQAWGHPNVRATHRTTFEITSDDYLTPRGDCIIGIRSSVTPRSLPQWFKSLARSRDSIIIVVLCSGGVCDTAVGRGHPGLSFGDGRRMVFRRSSHVGPETVMIGSSKAATDLRRDLVEVLRRGAVLRVGMTVVRRSEVEGGGLQPPSAGPQYDSDGRAGARGVLN
ncbi:DUF371 domain-containing protein [Aeropyrum camini]|uniref:DUF371 domain-containing protein n=1 Tax=Aeropyrum camini TaxID=229980 RepID=UPI000A92914A|nr:DUF371 domain-containing protein [Aeropyrum camini]